MGKNQTGGKNMKTLLQNRGGQMKPYSVIDTYNQAVYDICPTLKTTYDKNNSIFVVAPNPRTDGVNNTLSTSTKDNMLAMIELRMEDGCMVDKEGHRYRIRKLTPTECFRLMDVDDDDIEKMKQAGIAKTNLYKLAGNSIVVSCMFHIFRKLFIEKECENEQLSLF